MSRSERAAEWRVQVGQSLKFALRACCQLPCNVQSPFREGTRSLCVARRRGAPLGTLCVCKGMQTQQGCCWLMLRLIWGLVGTV